MYVIPVPMPERPLVIKCRYGWFRFREISCTSCWILVSKVSQKFHKTAKPFVTKLSQALNSTDHAPSHNKNITATIHHHEQQTGCRNGTLKVLMYDPNVGRLKGKDTATEDIGR